MIGIPFPDIDWCKDGISLIQNDGVIFERKDGKVSCSLVKTCRTDSGIYQLKVSNAYGSTVSEARLTVHGRLLQKLSLYLKITKLFIFKTYF